MSQMNKTGAVMHFSKNDKDIEKDHKFQTNYKEVNNRSSSTSNMNQIATEKMPEIIMPNIKKENVPENKLFESSQKFYRNKFGIAPDIDKVKDELQRFKQEYNKKNKELNLLKIDYFKLQVFKIIKYRKIIIKHLKSLMRSLTIPRPAQTFLMSAMKIKNLKVIFSVNLHPTQV